MSAICSGKRRGRSDGVATQQQVHATVLGTDDDRKGQN